jgi:hypothetical protein
MVSSTYNVKNAEPSVAGNPASIAQTM